MFLLFALFSLVSAQTVTTTTSWSGENLVNYRSGYADRCVVRDWPPGTVTSKSSKVYWLKNCMTTSSSILTADRLNFDGVQYFRHSDGMYFCRSSSTASTSAYYLIPSSSTSSASFYYNLTDKRLQNYNNLSGGCVGESTSTSGLLVFYQGDTNSLRNQGKCLQFKHQAFLSV